MQEEFDSIKRLLKKADKKDSKREVFGANKHQYCCNPPIVEEMLQKLEEDFHIILSKEYRNFLKFIGNGGAGPYYGLYPIEKAFDYNKEFLCMPCLLKPNMTEKQWQELLEEYQINEEDDEWEKIYSGILPIGTQGCTYEMGLILTGEYRGRIVYFDYDYENIPFFVEENDFLKWYIRWLEEVVNGYHIFWFGYNAEGNEKTLIDKYQKAETEERKLYILDSFLKFPRIKKKTENFIWNIQYDNSEVIKEKVTDILLHFDCKKGKKLLELLWNKKRYAAVVRLVWKRQKNDFEKWGEKIFRITDILQGKDVVIAAYILKNCSKMTVGDILKLLDNPNTTEEEKYQIVYCTKQMYQKEKYIEQYIRLFLEKDDFFRLIVIQTLSDMKNEKLFEIYDDFIKKQRTTEEGERIYTQVKKGKRVYGSTIANIFSNLNEIYKNVGKRF